MNRNTDKEKWIDDVLNSTKGMQKAASNPFLYEKIIFRMQQPGKDESTSKVFVPKWAALVILIVLVNCFSIAKYINKEHAHPPAGANQHLLSEFNTETTYNY